MEMAGEDEDDLYPTEALLAITGVHTELDLQTLEVKISLALDLASGRVSVMEVEDGRVLFVVYPEEPLMEKADQGGVIAAEEVAQKINHFIKCARGEVQWLAAEAKCTVVTEMEEEVLIDEEDALNMWREMPESFRTSHLIAVPSPDGVLIMPTHEASAVAPEGFVSPTHSQLQRDPSLLELDNVLRVDTSQLGTVSWLEPVIITGTAAPLDDRLTLAELVGRFGDADVRSGNRNTLVENGFVNSKPMKLREAMAPAGGSPSMRDPECSRIVFSPVKELSELFRQDLASLIAAFPCEHASQGREQESKQFTLCLGNEGFGIGFHRHSSAMFLLVVGRKKWYMGPQATEDDTPTHPGFYTNKSSHKCIQHPGEVLYVPDQWYHEIFNLEYTAGIQALPC